MGQQFESHHEASVPATPEQVWDAIATGPGITSWFVGHTRIDGDHVETRFGDDWMPAGTITTHDEPTRFAYASDPAPDGRFIAYEYLIEGRDHSATVLRTVTSGFLPGDDWADEYEAMTYGTDLFFATLVETLRHFPGRTGNALTTLGPAVTDWSAAWRAVTESLGLPATPAAGDRTRDGGHVYLVNPHTLAVRTGQRLDRYLRGLHGSLVTITTTF